MPPRKKKGAFGNKAARFRANGTAFSAAAPSNAPRNTGGNRQEFRGRDADNGFLLEEGLAATSMQEVARNTRNKTSHWDQDSRLRDRPVAFVSGGFVEPLAELELSGKPTPSLVETNAAPRVDTGDFPDSNRSPASPITRTISFSLQEASDGNTQPLHETFDAQSDSSDEVILFKGRDGLKAKNCALTAMPSIASVPTFTSSSTRADAQIPYSTLLRPHEPSRLDMLIAGPDNESESDAAIQDYIANMDPDDMLDMIGQLSTNCRDLGGLHNDIVITTTRDSKNDNSDRSEEVDDKLNKPTSSSESDNGVPDTGTEDSDGGEGEGEEDGDEDDEDSSWKLASQIDDEQLARLLAKQEELGLGVDELVLFDGDSLGPTDADEGRWNQPKKPGKPKGHGSWKQKMPAGYDFTKGLRTSDGSFPNAEAVADAFEQLQVTTKKHGRYARELELSDVELEATLKASWQKDRLRKKERKKAREELRAQGLLGKKVNALDPRVKYPNGMNLEDMKDEFHSFLLGSEHSATLSPMDAHARKLVHEIAYRFNIKSKSVGSGDQRRPTLVRTKSTVPLDEDEFDNVFAKHRRRFFPRLDRSGSSRRAGGGRGGDSSSAIVRHGEIVGGSAPEISQANKGRTMLEKLGWTKGMALGALDNKGMTQPIEHVVKRSKAGLG